MFEGFEARKVRTSGTEIFARVGGEGPPILLLHGYPETHAMWQPVAPRLAEHFTVVAADLRGYGDSGKPPSTDDHASYSKRVMAQDMVEVMAALGFDRFTVAGHDRGGRVAYRLAFDHPDAVSKLITLDIVPTHAQWRGLDWRGSMGAYHWYFLAQPAPLPERLIGADPVFYLHNTMARWAAPGFSFAPEAMAEYERAWSNPETVRAACEDYRAGASIDFAIDDADYGVRKIRPPMLALWGQVPGRPARDLVATWREWAEDVRGAPIPCGHFLPEEAPEETARAVIEFGRG